MPYEHCTTEQLVQEITGRRIHNLPHLLDIKRNPDLLLSIVGIGAASARRIRAAIELGIRYATEPALDKSVISGLEEVVSIYGPRLRDLDHERFYVLLLNNADVVTDEVLVSKGIQNSTVVHPREFFCEAIRRSASSVILLPNHPSGVREASHMDHTITKQLVEAGRRLDITVKDHIIICSQSFLFFAENGWLD